MAREPIIIKHFNEEHYATIFNPITGFFARVEDPGYNEPLWSAHGPELVDISITNWCDKGCALCYRMSDERGKRISLSNYELIIYQARQMHVLQVALGGGNPNQHPDFCEILRLTRTKYGIVPNYTTNGRGLTEDVLQATRRYCGAVAVSAYYPYEETHKAINDLASYGIKTNVHFILNNASIDTAIDWLERPPSFLSKVNALIFLNYKPIGRYASRQLLLKNSSQSENFFRLATELPYPFKIGFDSCLVSGVARFTKISSVCFDDCDAGRFSMFVSEDLKAYPCSFMANTEYEGIPIANNNLLSIWRGAESFRQIRSKLVPNHCIGCGSSDICKGGCPLFPELNLCDDWLRRSEVQQKIKKN